MNTYISLYKLTEQGIKNIKDAPKWIEEVTKGFEAMGGKVKGFYTVMGEYDYVSIAEAPNDETAMTFALTLGSSGNVRTTTLKAFTSDELTELVKPIPPMF
jgi:uncharacterized protein with GYD domain